MSHSHIKNEDSVEKYHSLYYITVHDKHIITKIVQVKIPAYRGTKLEIILVNISVTERQ